MSAPSFQLEPSDGAIMLRLGKRVEMEEVKPLWEQLKALPGAVSVDAAHTTFVHISVLQLLLVLNRGGRPVTIVKRSPELAQALRRLGIEEF